MALRIYPSFAIHAGEWLKTEIVQAHGVSINDLTEAFGVSRQSVSALLNGRAALTADMAIRFEHAFGVKAETLMRMQARYELGKAREHEADLAVRSLIAA
ncbi:MULTISPECIES: HigA family addiction module antitoxin [Sphingobium]|uniref:Putative plasmid maintenance system antidote protein n=1 Tax=Sphingobium indicum (strain DSM 16413 / CCM 7287 / MTCC 6362 / UT26 / NBRC 101211 / UT26S) TaxID=452662 RepID=D4YZN4_SPHIU|nr:HigA family addiction module antitoxin [Sphingobium indicum]BAI95816.1 putative plasmid maintenance system antidote protein [Sphingobium indicum UT26S]